MPVNHVDRMSGRKQRPLLPGADVTEMLSGEVVGSIRLTQHCIIGILVGTVSGRNAEAVRHFRPGDRHRFFKLTTAPGMQSFDRSAAQFQLLRERPRSERARGIAEAIAAEKDSLLCKKAIAWVPNQDGGPLDPGDAAVDLVIGLPEPPRLPCNLDGVAVSDVADRRGVVGRKVGFDRGENLEWNRDQAVCGIDCIFPPGSFV